MHTHTQRHVCRNNEYNCFKNEIKVRLKINQILSLDFNCTVRFLYLSLNLFKKIPFTEEVLFLCSPQFLILVPTKYCVSDYGRYLYF